METTAVVVTEAMLSPVTSAITDNLDVLLPAGLGIMGIMLGVSLIPWTMCLTTAFNMGDVKLSLIDLEPYRVYRGQQGASVKVA